jgi:MFS family permease
MKDRGYDMIEVDTIHFKRMKDKLRLIDSLLVSLVLTAVVAWIAPQQLGILAYKGALVAGAIFMGYWADRRLFPFNRPHEHVLNSRHAEYRRAIIIAACLLAVGLGA